MEYNDEQFRVDIIDFLIIELDKKINQDNNNEMLQRVKIYLLSHKSNCMNYIYTSNRYKESALIMTNIFRNIVADLTKEIIDVLP